MPEETFDFEDFSPRRTNNIQLISPAESHRFTFNSHVQCKGYLHFHLMRLLPLCLLWNSSKLQIYHQFLYNYEQVVQSVRENNKLYCSLSNQRYTTHPLGKEKNAMLFFKKQCRCITKQRGQNALFLDGGEKKVKMKHKNNLLKESVILEYSLFYAYCRKYEVPRGSAPRHFGKGKNCPFHPHDSATYVRKT